MIDLYIKGSVTKDLLTEYLAFTFEIGKESIVISTHDEIENIKVSNECLCLGLLRELKGDIDYVLEVWRIKKDLNDFIKMTQLFINKVDNIFYVPIGSFNEFYKIKSNMPLTIDRLDEFDNDIILLKS